MTAWSRARVWAAAASIVRPSVGSRSPSTRANSTRSPRRKATPLTSPSVPLSWPSGSPSSASLRLSNVVSARSARVAGPAPPRVPRSVATGRFISRSSTGVDWAAAVAAGGEDGAAGADAACTHPQKTPTSPMVVSQNHATCRHACAMPAPLCGREAKHSLSWRKTGLSWRAAGARGDGPQRQSRFISSPASVPVEIGWGMPVCGARIV